MKKKLLLLALAAVMAMLSCYAVFAEEAQQGTTYYVSSENGDDANDGTSEKKAFKSLDKINDINTKLNFSGRVKVGFGRNIEIGFSRQSFSCIEEKTT